MRSRVTGHIDHHGVGGNSRELRLSCGHVLFVSPFGRYAKCKTITCISSGCDGRRVEEVARER